MTIPTMCTIPMKKLILLVQKKKTYRTLSLNKKNHFNTQITTWSLKKNYYIFAQTLITVFYIPQWTQVSWLFIIMIQNICIDDPEYFSQYRSWHKIGHEGKTLHPDTTQVSTAQLDVLSNSHMFIDITIFTCIIPVKCNVQILNGRKFPATVFVLVIMKIPKINFFIPLWTSYYMPQNPQNTISQTALKNYNQFRIVRNEALGLLQITTDAWIKLKVETIIKERDQRLLDFITIYVINIEQQHPSSQYITTLTITPIINRSLNKHPNSSAPCSRVNLYPTS